MNQAPYPAPQYPYRVPPNPLLLCRRAGWIAFGWGMLIALYFIFNFASMYVSSPEALMEAQRQSKLPSGEMPFTPAQLRQMALVFSAIATAVGLTLMILATPIRRGSKGAAISAMVVTGLIGGLLLLFTVLSAVTGLVAPVMLAMACCFSVPLGLTIWLFIALLQAVRAISFAQRMGVAQQMGYVPMPGPLGFPVPGSGSALPGNSATGDAQAAGSHHTGPATPMQPMPMQPVQMTPPTPPPPQPMFGPAPFGIPPPPSETPAGKYGYPTKPTAEPKPPEAPQS